MSFFDRFLAALRCTIIGFLLIAVVLLPAWLSCLYSWWWMLSYLIICPLLLMFNDNY